MRVVLAGTEELTIEIQGTAPPAVAQALVGPEIELDLAGGLATIGLLVFSMKNLGLIALPTPGMDYREALWRVGILRGGRRAWFSPVCDLDSQLVRVSSRFMTRYPARFATISIATDGWRCTSRVAAGGRTLAIDAISSQDVPPPEPPRELFVRDGGLLYQIPWEEVPAPTRTTAKVNVADTLSEVTLGANVAWASDATVHRGRTHKCGLAVLARRA